VAAALADLADLMGREAGLVVLAGRAVGRAGRAARAGLEAGLTGLAARVDSDRRQNR
jgi:hypothetical protein